MIGGKIFARFPEVIPPLYNPVLDALIRDIKGRQSIMRSLREDAETDNLQFIGSANMNVAPRSLAARIMKEIGFDLRTFRQQNSVEGAFAYLRSKIEEAGIFVLLLGNLGSRHTDISVDIFRGYAISDEIAPVVVINDHDAKSAWAFTALHEVTHLWLGTTGISGFMPEVRIERYCNDVAGEILLPSSEHDDLARLRRTPFAQLIESVSAFATERRISRSMVAYRLLQLEAIKRETWSELTAHFKKAWLTRRQQEKLEDTSSGGPNYYVVKRHRLGKALLGLASRSISEGLLSPTKAGLLLGVKPRNVAPLLFGDGSVRGGR